MRSLTRPLSKTASRQTDYALRPPRDLDSWSSDDRARSVSDVPYAPVPKFHLPVAFTWPHSSQRSNSTLSGTRGPKSTRCPAALYTKRRTTPEPQLGQSLGFSLAEPRGDGGCARIRILSSALSVRLSDACHRTDPMLASNWLNGDRQSTDCQPLCLRALRDQNVIALRRRLPPRCPKTSAANSSPPKHSVSTAEMLPHKPKSQSWQHFSPPQA
jgi:hypothetical protein